MATNSVFGGRFLPNDSDVQVRPPEITSSDDSQLLLDIEIVRAAATGDQTAFAYLFKTRSGKISRYLNSLLLDKSDAEESVAEVFVTAWRNLKKLRQPERFDSWLFRIAHNHAVDRMRKRKQTEPLDSKAATNKVDTNPQRCPETSLELAEQQQFIRETLLQLPDEQREVLTLRFLAEMSHAEVARQMDRSAEAVRALQYRGLKTLRSTIGGSN